MAGAFWACPGWVADDVKTYKENSELSMATRPGLPAFGVVPQKQSLRWRFRSM